MRSVKEKEKFKRALARITFLKPEEGGRKRQLQYDSSTSDEFFYCAIVVFDANPIDPRLEAWDLVVTDPIACTDNNMTMLAKIYYGGQGIGAPDELISTGATFKLFEGPHLVARGVVLSEPE